MIVTDVRFCPVCHGKTELKLDKTLWVRWMSGELIQHVWPEWSVEERELLISGTHAACWDELYPEEES